MSAHRAEAFRRYVLEDTSEEPPLTTLERARALFISSIDVEPVSLRTRILGFPVKARMIALCEYLVIVGGSLAILAMLVRAALAAH